VLKKTAKVSDCKMHKPKPPLKTHDARTPRFTRDVLMIMVSYRRVRGVVRQIYNIRLVPLETTRFRFGLPLGKTLSRARAERYIDHVAEYLSAWLEGPR